MLDVLGTKEIRSNMRYYTFVKGNMVIWYFQKQKFISYFGAKVEY